jgi:ditrans,polycis-polyprenyl diphosphate synthase
LQLSEEQRRNAGKNTFVRRVQRLLCSVLAAGPVPRHIAFIMDGNRRYATAHGVDRAQGHAHGFEKVRMKREHALVASCLEACSHSPAEQLLDALEWCFDLGVQVVTVYAFSIENFKARAP